MNPYELQGAFNDAIICALIYGVCIVFRVQAWLGREGLEKAQKHAMPYVSGVMIGSFRIFSHYSAYIGLAMIIVGFTVEMFMNFVNLKVDKDRKLEVIES